MPGVCLCHKEIDRFPSSSTAPKSEILGMTTSGRLSSESLPCFPWPLFYLSNRFQVRIRSHPANSETVISFERGNPTRAVMPFEQNVRLVTARSEQRLQARGMRNSPTFHAALSRARTCACVRSYRNLSVYRWL